MAALVEINRTDFVAEVQFSNPPYHFVSPELIGAIADALDAIDQDDRIRCTILSSTGNVFCAGANLASEEFGGAEAMAQIAGLYAQAERLFRRRKPMIAAVQGAAVGAGLGLALAADFRVAAPRARFSANFVRLGFHPGFGLTCTLPRLLGIQHASRMMLTAERIRPETALQWGLVDLLAGESELMAEAHRFASSIAGNAPLALDSVRASLMASLADEVAAAMRREHAKQAALHKTEDYREGVASVFERRDPTFVGR